MWTYGTLRIRKVVTGGYWVSDAPYTHRNIRIPRIVLWTISRNGIKIRTTVSFSRAREIANLLSQ